MVKDITKELQIIKKEIEQCAQSSYKDALPAHIKPETFAKYAYNYIANNPLLLEKDRGSLFKSLMTLAQLGLPPEGVLGQAYLLPFKNEVQVIIGYRGYLTLARQSGEVSSIYAFPVFEKDEFHYEYGLHPDLKHVPFDGDRGKLKCAYAVVNYMNGGSQFVVVTQREIDKAKSSSASYRNAKDNKETIWNKYDAEMYTKTAIRRLIPYLPLSIQRADALEFKSDEGNIANINNDGIIEVESLPTENENEAAKHTPRQYFVDLMNSNRGKLEAISGRNNLTPAEFEKAFMLFFGANILPEKLAEAAETAAKEPERFLNAFGAFLKTGEKKTKKKPEPKEEIADPQGIFKSIFDNETNQKLISELSGNASTPVPRNMFDAYLKQYIPEKDLAITARKAKENPQAFCEKFAEFIAKENMPEEPPFGQPEDKTDELFNQL